MLPKISNTPMSQSERQLLQDLHQSMANAFVEQCWTFMYNKETGVLDLIQKTGPSCHTRYCPTKSELLTWYKNTLKDIADPTYIPPLVDYATVFAEYAEYYGISYEVYIDLITQTINRAFTEHPEYFI